MMRIVILGAGFMGRTHAEAFSTIPGVEIAGIVGRSQRGLSELARRFAVPALTDAEQVLDDGSVDAIDIALPTGLHREVVVRSLEHGKDVFCEKPIALTLEDATAMIEAARRTGRLLQIAHVLRFWPEYREIHDRVASGGVGKPLSAFVSRLSFRPSWSDWIQDPAQTGGQVVDLMIHDFDYLNWVLGVPRRVTASGVRGKADIADHAWVALDYGEAQGMAEGSVLMPDSFPFSSTVRMICEDATLEYAFRAAGPSVEMGQTASALTLFPVRGEAETLHVPQVNPYDAECRYFVECVRGRKPGDLLRAESARDALRVSLAARDSLRRGQAVQLDASVP